MYNVIMHVKFGLDVPSNREVIALCLPECETGKIVLLTVPRQYLFSGSFVLFMSCVCVLIHIKIKGEVGAVVKAFQ